MLTKLLSSAEIIVCGSSKYRFSKYLCKCNQNDKQFRSEMRRRETPYCLYTVGIHQFARSVVKVKIVMPHKKGSYINARLI